MREIIYNVSLGGISPSTVQSAGVQGEDAATAVKFVIANDIDTANCTFLINATDGSGVFYTTDFLTVVDRTVTYTLPVALTAAGGIATLVLVVNGQNSTVMSYPAKLRFEDSGEGAANTINYTAQISDALSRCQGLSDSMNSVVDRVENTLLPQVQAAAQTAAEAASAAQEIQEANEQFTDYLTEMVEEIRDLDDTVIDYYDQCRSFRSDCNTYKNQSKNSRDQALDYLNQSRQIKTDVEGIEDNCEGLLGDCQTAAVQAASSATLCAQAVQNLPQTVSATLQTQIWECQPDLDEGDTTGLYVNTIYYVHIVDSASGRFKLTTVRGDTNYMLPAVFRLYQLDTVNCGRLSENTPVVLTSISPDCFFRHAGDFELGVNVPNAKAYEISIDGVKCGDEVFYLLIDNNTYVNYHTGNDTEIRGIKVGTNTLSSDKIYQNVFMRLSKGSKNMVASYDYVAMCEGGGQANEPDNVTQTANACVVPNVIPNSPITVSRISLNSDSMMLNGFTLTVKPIF